MNHLFPVPREEHPGDPSARFAGSPRRIEDASLPTQGYELHVDRDEAELRHADAAGLRYGLDAVAQLRSPDGTLPAVTVRDHPDIAVRGFMLDTSRDRVPTRDTLERLVSILATARYNHLQLYVEHTFAYRDHADVWRDASPITADDLRWLDGLCAANGIELVANQNCFGHMGRWLALDRYRSMADSPDGVQVMDGLTFPPSVLAPTEENARFVLDLVREQSAALRSRTVNVGCDETFELGRGASSARAAEVGVDGVYVEHLRRIVGPLLEEGRSVQFWGDVIAHHPERLAELRAWTTAAGDPTAGDLTALVWNYDAPDVATPTLPAGIVTILADLGIDLETPTDFDTRLRPFADAGIPFWVAPGTSTWNSIVGRWGNARANLLDAARSGRDRGATGYLVTDWGDNGHHQPPSVSDLPVLYGGAVSWCAETNADIDIAAVADRLVYDDPTGSVGAALEAIGSVAHGTGRIGRNTSPLFASLFPHQMHLVGGEADPSMVAEVIETLDRARSALADADPRAADASTVVEELDVAIGLARHAAVRMGSTVGLGDPGPAATRADLSSLVKRYRAAWLLRSRPGGLSDSADHLERTLSDYPATG